MRGSLDRITVVGGGAVSEGVKDMKNTIEGHDGQE
jgi:hypothetical protein